MSRATPINVLHVTTRMILGGADENTLFTVNLLDPRRFRVALAVGGGSEPAMLAQVASHVDVVEIPELVRELSPRHDITAYRTLGRHLGARAYDVVHTHMAKGGILGRFAARAARVPAIVHTLHGSTFHRHLDPLRYAMYWSLEKVAATFTDCIVSVGEDLRDRYLAARIGTPAQYQVIRSGMELSRFLAAADLPADRRRALKQSLGVPADAPLVGKVARLEPRKGHRYFLDMARRVGAQRPDVHFVALGAGDLLEALSEEARRQGLAGRVHFAGFRDDIAEVLAALDIIVLTSLWEGLPRVLVQAAATGVPAVTFEVEGAHEVVRQGVNGYVVPSKDVERMADRVLELLADPVRARGMGRAGQAIVHSGWTVESMMREITALYETLCR